MMSYMSHNAVVRLWSHETSNLFSVSSSSAVKNFIDHLGNQEKQLLLKGLTQNVNQPSNDNGGNITSTPSVGQLRLVFLHQLFPFLGFGFLDNLIMIVAGDYIDTTIGITLGISVRVYWIKAFHLIDDILITFSFRLWQLLDLEMLCQT